MLPYQHLINLLKNRSGRSSHFVLFLGAGASVESGVPSASDLVKQWRDEFSELHPGVQREELLEAQNWYEDTNEYSRLFETLYDHPSQRREYIERALEKASPSWGYIYLTNLIRKGVINTVFTTNFDDLVNEACYLFSPDVRPIVCSHDSSIASVRMTADRPKIVKLHGDFLFDSIKNTVRELESLESNMREKFSQYAGEYGLIVVGYGGNDRSVMDSLDALLREEGNFPHGVYWCLRDDEAPRRVEELARFPKFKQVQIPGFDALMAEIHDAVVGEIHPLFRNPYDVVAKRVNSLFSKLSQPAPGAVNRVIVDHIRSLSETLANDSLEKAAIKLPRRFLATVAYGDGHEDAAFGHLVDLMKGGVGAGRSRIKSGSEHDFREIGLAPAGFEPFVLHADLRRLFVLQ